MLKGISNCIANITGFVVPTVIGSITLNNVLQVQKTHIHRLNLIERQATRGNAVNGRRLEKKQERSSHIQIFAKFYSNVLGIGDILHKEISKEDVHKKRCLDDLYSVGSR